MPLEINMRNLAGLTTVILTVTFIAASALPQERVVRRMGDEPARPIDYRFPDDRDEVTVPIRLVGNAVLIPVTLGDSAVFWVTLDTGMPADRSVMLWDSPSLDALGLGLAVDTTIRIAGAGGTGQAFTPRVALGISIGVGDLSIRDIEVHTLPQRGAPYKRDDGVIGRMLLANFVTELDFDRLQMRLYRPGTFQASDGWSEVPVTFKMGNPILQAAVVIDKDSSLPVQLVVDLGAAHTLSLFTEADPRIHVPQPNIATTLGWGISGPVLGQIARISSLLLGDHQLDHVICTFPQNGHQDLAGTKGRHGNLGCGALARFNLVFDYAGSRLLLKPNRSFGDPFEQEMAGLALKDDGDAFTVTEVLPNSPAAEAGISAGDRIVAVNDRPAAQIGYLNLRKMLKQPGKELAIGVERDGQRMNFRITLRRLI